MLDLSVGGQAFKIIPKTQKKRVGVLASFFKCGAKTETQRRANGQDFYKPYEPNLRIRLLPMGVCPGMTIKRYLGIVDVHVIRILRIVRVED